MMAMALVLPQRLVHLSLVDSIIIVFYFALVLAIGFYLKRQSNTSEDYFLAGRQMSFDRIRRGRRGPSHCWRCANNESNDGTRDTA